MKGLIQQIEEVGKTYKPEEITRQDFIDFFEESTKQRREFLNKIDKMEKEHTKHFVKRAAELGEEAPLWLMLVTSPRMNMLNGGTFYTSREFIEKNRKWLNDYNK